MKVLIFCVLISVFALAYGLKDKSDENAVKPDSKEGSWDPFSILDEDVDARYQMSAVQPRYLKSRNVADSSKKTASASRRKRASDSSSILDSVKLLLGLGRSAQPEENEKSKSAPKILAANKKESSP